ncbi:hypothetical protein [Gimesia sp.]|uniref:hypothetical protein n=1 Tax=Gimesia sp. TaxID=2024833 RepID=UPI003A914F02
MTCVARVSSSASTGIVSTCPAEHHESRLLQHAGFNRLCHLFPMSSSKSCGSTRFAPSSFRSGAVSATITPVSRLIALIGERRSRESSIRKPGTTE